MREPQNGLTPENQETKAQLPILTSIAHRLQRRPTAGIGGHPHPEGEQKTAIKSGTLRAAIFGVNDGLVSNVALIMGVAGAGVSNRVILLAGVAGLLAGAFSMGAGEYISMRVQREMFERLLHLEAQELAAMPEEEAHELAAIYARKGVPPDLAREVADALMQDPEVALETHAREELGLDPQEGLGSPWGAASSSFLTFSFGALVPLVAFLFGSGNGAILVSAVATGLTLFLVGALMAAATGKHTYASGFRMLAVGASAALITFGVGKLLHVNAA